MRIEVYKDKKRQYRWHCKAVNGRVIAESGESYHNLADLYDVLSTLRSGAFKSAEIVELDEAMVVETTEVQEGGDGD